MTAAGRTAGLRTLPAAVSVPQSELMLIPAIVLITAALIFYSIGVWAERIRRERAVRGDAAGDHRVAQLKQDREHSAEQQRALPRVAVQLAIAPRHASWSHPGGKKH